MDPLLHLLEKDVVSQPFGHIYACADDIGIAVRDINASGCVFGLLERMRKASGLVLKPRQCVLILLVVAPSNNNVLCMQEWMRKHISDWVNMQIRDKGTYLGLHLGPGMDLKDN